MNAHALHAVRPSQAISSTSDEHEGTLEALRRGNPVALRRFYTDHLHDVSRIVRRVLGPDHEHDDLVHEVFYHALKQLHGYRGDQGGLRPWLRQIAVRRCLKTIRYRRVRWWLSWRAPQELPEPAQPTSSHHAMLLRRAYRLIAELKPQEQLVFTLRHIEQLTIPEIVDVTALSRSTVKRRLESARQSFHTRASRDPLLADWVRHDDDQEAAP